MPAAAVIGAQFGSEGKGAVAAAMADKFEYHLRTGGPNAGHTFYKGGRKWVMQSIPCGAVWPHTRVIIGAGAVVDVEQLLLEISRVEEVRPDIWRNVCVDPRAVVITGAARDDEGGVGGDDWKRIGSTGKGVGVARRDHLMRGRLPCQHAGEVLSALGYHHLLCDTVPLVHRAATTSTLLLEGTQGAGLSLFHGPKWPYCTSADVGIAAMCSEAGLAPSHVTERWLVARTHPIRVGGNSGPLLREMTWDEIRAQSFQPDLEPERTTVTKTVRRIGAWDGPLFRKSVMMTDPTDVVFTFMDYLDLPAAQASSVGVDSHPRWRAWAADRLPTHSARVHLRWGPGPEHQERVW